MKKRGFFAYGSNPISCGECIEEAIQKINSGDTVEIRSWKDLKVSGKYIISDILNQIDKCDFFCADITGVNDNVLFELGYAITKRKPLFLIHDISHLEAYRRYKELALLETIGQSRYSNTDDIVNCFYKEQPYNSQSKLLWNTLIETLETEHPYSF